MDSAACWAHPLDADARHMQQALQPAWRLLIQAVSLMIPRPTNTSGIGPPIETMGGLQPTIPSTCARKRKPMLQQRALQSTTKPCFSCPTPQTSTPKCPTPRRGLRARRAAASHGETHGQNDDCDVGTTDWHVPHLTKYVSMAMAPVVSSTPTAFATPRLNLPATHESTQRRRHPIHACLL